MFLLSVPGLEQRLAGMALVSSAPHAGWRSRFADWVRDNPIPDVDDAARAHAERPGDDTLRALTLAAAPWNFTPHGLAAGRAVLADLPYCQEAMAWAAQHFDDDYRARWTPRTLPTLIVSGSHDHVVDQRLWQEDGAFRQPHVLHRTIDGAGHFPWVENPRAVRAAFEELNRLVEERARR